MVRGSSNSLVRDPSPASAATPRWQPSSASAPVRSEDLPEPLGDPQAAQLGYYGNDPKYAHHPEELTAPWALEEAEGAPGEEDAAAEQVGLYALSGRGGPATTPQTRTRSIAPLVGDGGEPVLAQVLWHTARGTPRSQRGWPAGSGVASAAAGPSPLKTSANVSVRGSLREGPPPMQGYDEEIESVPALAQDAGQRAGPRSPPPPQVPPLMLRQADASWSSRSVPQPTDTSEHEPAKHGRFNKKPRQQGGEKQRRRRGLWGWLCSCC
jgi:hypothetical protein